VHECALCKCVKSVLDGVARLTSSNGNEGSSPSGNPYRHYNSSHSVCARLHMCVHCPVILIDGCRWTYWIWVWGHNSDEMWRWSVAGGRQTCRWACDRECRWKVHQIAACDCDVAIAALKRCVHSLMKKQTCGFVSAKL